MQLAREGKSEGLLFPPPSLCSDFWGSLELGETNKFVDPICTEGSLSPGRGDLAPMRSNREVCEPLLRQRHPKLDLLGNVL